MMGPNRECAIIPTMFGLWGKKKAQNLIRERDLVFMTRKAADLTLLQAARASKKPVLICSSFSASLVRIRDASATVGQPFQLATKDWPSQPVEGAAPFLLHTNMMTLDSGFDAWLRRMGQGWTFLFVEHHPILAAEDAILALLETASAVHPQQTQFFVGLDEPLMAMFGGGRIIELMKTLGLSENEAIEHPLVDRSLTKARLKFQKRIHVLRSADSDVEWYASNVRKEAGK
jgi:hypothetical protein